MIIAANLAANATELLTWGRGATKMGENPKVVRVEIEYENGKVLRQIGDKAAEIWRYVESALTMEHIHGRPYQGPILEEVAGETSDAER